MAEGLWSLRTTQLRDFATDRHRTVDDTPSGGGAGMVLKPDILAAAIDAVSPEGDPRPRLLMSPRGVPLTQERVRELALGPGAVIVCPLRRHRPARHRGACRESPSATMCWRVARSPPWCCSGGGAAASRCAWRRKPCRRGFENGLLESRNTRPQVFEARKSPPF
jgi:tRNA (guanine37-N1)-methyltransferase